jgi:hypothetical protein
MPIKLLHECLLSPHLEDIAWAEAEIERILLETPEINPGFELPEVKGVVRYDSDVHTMADVALMTPYFQRRVQDARARNPKGRLVLTQTQDMPGDTQNDRRALIAAKHGVYLVPGVSPCS